MSYQNAATIKKYYELYNITINVKKKKWLTTKNRWEMNIVFKINGQNVEQVHDFKYLGYEISEDGKHSKHLNLGKAPPKRYKR